MLTKSQIEDYFEQRLPGQRLNFNLKNVPAKCPFHEDQNASLSIHAETGRWKCHGCGARGNLLSFEQRLNSSSPDSAQQSVASLLGVPFERVHHAVYTYTDAFGHMLFEKIRIVRNGKKYFQARRRDRSDKWVWSLDGIEDKPLYQLKRLVVSRFVFICNGEKAADALNEAFDHAQKTDCCATCTYDGEGKWRNEYARWLAGKAVSIFPDNDEIGTSHAAVVAASSYPLAHVVKVVPLPGLPEKGDVYDFLEQHTVDELLEAVKQAPVWRPAEQEKKSRLFVPATEFMMRRADQNIDWAVEGAIQRGGNGMIVAPPGSGKSYVALDLAISLATRTPFLGLHVPQALRVAFMAREDHPELTRWRSRHLVSGKGISTERMELLESNLWFNTKEDMPEFSLDNDDYMIPVMEELDRFRPDIIFFDVLKVMHGSDENDNTAMHRVMAQVTRMTTRLKCSAAIIHHQGYATRGGSLKLRARGASAIGGWPEWVLGLSISNPEDPQKEWIRRVEFESKMAAAHDPVEFVIWSEREDGPIILKTTREDVPVAAPSRPVQQRFPSVQ